MPDPLPIQDFFCPRCKAEVHEQWKACPECGLALRPANDLLVRAALWSGLLAGFVILSLLVYRENPNNVPYVVVFFGLPLAYLFGKAVLFRIQGRPLTWKDLGWTSFRVAVVGMFLTIVLPALIGMAALVLLFVVCGTMLLTSGGGMH